MKETTRKQHVMRRRSYCLSSLMFALVLFVMLFMPNLLFESTVSAEPAVAVDDSYVKVFTNIGKPVWVKLSLPSGNLSAALNPGGMVSFRLDYVFDDTQKPTPGETLNMAVSGFPNGTFILPSNMHTEGNRYYNNIISLKFADVGGYTLATGLSGWMTVTFLASGDASPGTYQPNIVGNGSAGNVIKITHIEINEPGTDPGPVDPGDGSYLLMGKLSEHVLFKNGVDDFAMMLYSYQVPDTPSYISYEIVLNDGSGIIWADNVKDFDYDYIVFTDTLGPGQEFVTGDGEPYTTSSYGGTAPVYSIAAWKKDPITGLVSGVSNEAVDRTDPKVQLVVSPDKRTFTLTVEKGARINGTTETVDEYTTLRLDYYAKVTDPAATSFSNSASVEFIKGGSSINDSSSVKIDVIKQSGADFIYKEVAKWGGTLKPEGTSAPDWYENYYVASDRGTHGPADPLILDAGDSKLLLYTVSYKNTGDSPKLTGTLTITDKLPDSVELVQLRTDPSNMYGHDLYGFDLTYDLPSHTITLVNNSDLAVGNRYWAQYVVKVKDTVEPGKPIINQVSGGNATVVKTDGYAIQVLKCDADDTTIPLMGVKFDLYSGATLIKTLTTGLGGLTTVENLPPGLYKLIETQYPAGYPVPASPVIVEFEILPAATGMKGINKIALYSSPGSMQLYDDNGVAVFKILNDIDPNPTGSITLYKNIKAEDKLDGRSFYVTLSTDAGTLLKFSGNTYDPDGDTTEIEINDVFPITLYGIPVNLGQIAIRETAGSAAGYSVFYTVGSVTTNSYAAVRMAEKNQTVFVTVTNNHESTGTSDLCSLTVSKAVSGIGADQKMPFDFIVEFEGADLGDIESNTATFTSLDGGKTWLGSLADGESVTFNKIRAGTYYSVKEPPIDDYLATIEGNEYGELTGVNVAAKFTNIYVPDSTYIKILGKKVLSGITDTDRVFTFNAVQVESPGSETPYASPTSLTRSGSDSVKGAGDFEIVIAGLTEGTYYFMVTEDQAGSGGVWSYSTEKFWVQVEVTDDGGSINASIQYPNGEYLSFTNIYTPEYTVTPYYPPVSVTKQDETPKEDPNPEEIQNKGGELVDEEILQDEEMDDDMPVPVRISRDIPPNPSKSGNELIADGDGWIELDENGVPLGRWSWDDDMEEWVFNIFDDDAPLSDMSMTDLPQTGVFAFESYMFFITLAIGTLLIGIGVLMNTKKGKRGRKEKTV